MTLEAEDLERRKKLRVAQREGGKMYRVQAALGHKLPTQGRLLAEQEDDLTPEEAQLCHEEREWQKKTKDARMERMGKHCPNCNTPTKLHHNDDTGQIIRTCPKACGWAGECNG